MGSRWGREGPPAEAYSRVTNPERFAPLHDIAAALLDRLDAEFLVAREEGVGLDPEIEPERPLRPTVRLVPEDPDAGVLTVAFTSFPGLRMRMGHWLRGAVPYCGCDACDETVEDGKHELEELTLALTSGQVRETVELQEQGDGRLVSEVGTSRGWILVERANAEAMLEAAGGRSPSTTRPGREGPHHRLPDPGYPELSLARGPFL